MAKMKKYGITEQKKAELDALETDVANAEYEVAQFQAIVASYTEKSNEFAGFLATAEANKATALSNKNVVEEVVNEVSDLDNNAHVVHKKSHKADKKIEKVAREKAQIINQLILSVEIVNKLADLINRKKALNPLISDDLVKIIAEAGTDANNAVAVSLVALKSCYASLSSAKETNRITTVTANQAENLHEALATFDPQELFDKARYNAKEVYNEGLPKKPDKQFNPQELFEKAWYSAKEVYDKGLPKKQDKQFKFLELFDKACDKATEVYVEGLPKKQNYTKFDFLLWLFNKACNKAKKAYKKGFLAKPHLQTLLDKAYKRAKTAYEEALTANEEVTWYLNGAKSKLEKATVKLNSLKAGLAAANAAALAS